MNKLCITLAALLVCGAVAAKETFDVETVQGWTLVEEVRGDLNADGVEDKVLIYQENNPRFIISNEGLGKSVLNTNKRKIEVWLRQPEGWQKITQNDVFIPPFDSDDSPCLEDPFGSVKITDKGILEVSLVYWLSCGSWYVSHEDYKFRYQEQGVRLIGKEYLEFTRNSGEQTQISTNYLTGKRKITTGLNMFDGPELPVIHWENLSERAPVYLEDL